MYFQIGISIKSKQIFVGVLKVSDEKSRIRSQRSQRCQRSGTKDPDPHQDPCQNVTDSGHWSTLIKIFVSLKVNFAFSSVTHTFFLVHFVTGVKNVSDDCAAGSIRLFDEPGCRLKM
jgi:hypothetical protein